MERLASVEVENDLLKQQNRDMSVRLESIESRKRLYDKTLLEYLLAKHRARHGTFRLEQ